MTIKSNTTLIRFYIPPSDPVCQRCPDCTSVKQPGGGGEITQSNRKVMNVIIEAVSCRQCRSIIIRAERLRATHLLKGCFDICARLIRARQAGFGIFRPPTTDESTEGRQVRNIHPSHPDKQQFRSYKRSCLYAGHRRDGTTRKHKAESVSWQGIEWHIPALPCRCLFLYSLE